MNWKFELGQKVIDTITDIKGTITARAEYITGCRQYSLTGKVRDDGKYSTNWFDEDRLELVQVKPVKLQATPTGGPQSHPSPKS